MAEGTVATPLTGENLVPQGVRDETALPQTPQTALHRDSAEAADTPNTAQIKNWIRITLRSGITRMEQLVKLADLMVRQLRNHPNDQLNGLLSQGFAQQVKIFAISQGESTEAITQFKGLLEKVHEDITAIRTTTTQISQSSNGSGTSTSDSAMLWKMVQTQAWQTAIRSASTPQSQSAGSSTPGVNHAELGMDCEIVVKIRDDSERALVKRLQPKDIVIRAEKARAHAAKSTPSLALAGHGFTAARQLPSGDISLRASHAAGAEVLRKHCTGWVQTFD
ncbi:hypothetical protein UA08_08957 [Talaromyces atroroseus]|uniref:Uncharacterized protein n=1 Tax=Talaromyces atroroseus TaxID=1441469 RepID=A0A1Q5Q7M7_TALAT|nr:hypothetical protein UA08_08957 [Talaromyces atroroseus]OKL55750.1 hypothetical protein UA08_08957 [Talaromyces atroroseus]